MSAWTRVLAAPSSLVARQALVAEWRAGGDPRVELVEKQLKLRTFRQNNSLYHPQARQLAADVRALLARHGAQWAGEIALLVSSYAFHRGCVAEVTLPGAKLAQLLPRLVELGPVQHVNLTAPLDLAAALATPALAKVTSLSIRELGAGFGDAEAAVVAGSARLSNLVWLQLTDNAIGEAGSTALAASPHLARIPYIDLRGNPVTVTPELVETNSISKYEPSALGERLQAKYGKRPWLAVPADPEHWPPDRDDLSVALRGDG